MRNKKPDNPSKNISASEINKFIYCNYQWYYERLYGKKYINELSKKRIENTRYASREKRIENTGHTSRESRFAKGREFHSSYLKTDKSRRNLKLALLFIAVIAVIAAAMLITAFLQN